MLNNSILDELTKDIFFFKGVLESTVLEKDRLLKEATISSEWLNKQPIYLKFLQNLQNALHQKNLGAFSQLLTYLIKDVLGKDKDILFDLYTYRNLPALKIESSNDGFREDIVEGNGGSIANIVSTGLRLIVLSRLKNRKFIILDEPDCWLKPDHVPEFAKIIGQLSEKLKIQTVIISHHDFNYFKDYGRVISLEKNGNFLDANIIHDTEVNDLNHEIISSVRLRNFMSHTDTFFKLHPYLTCIVGENDIGKSVLSTAFKSVVYGESSDSYIKHNTDESQILISLSSDRNILWQRFNKTNENTPQKVKYSLFSGNNLVTSEYNSSYCPRFIEEIMNISKVEDLDVHIGNQKQPVFLLSSDIKPNDRAKILSLGKESILVQNMMENIKIKTKEHNQVLKESTKRLSSLERIILGLENLNSLEGMLNSLTLQKKELEDYSKDISILENLCNELSNSIHILNINYLNAHPHVPMLFETTFISKILEDFTLSKDISNVDTIVHKEITPNIDDTEYLDKLINRLNLSKAGSEIMEVSISYQEPLLNNETDLSTIISKIFENNYTNITQVNTEIKQCIPLNDTDLFNLINELEISNEKLISLEVDQKNIVQKHEDIESEIELFIFENPVCPTCNQKIDIKVLNDK